MASADTAKSDSINTAWEFARFATFYYRDPKPERITQAIESLGPLKLLDDGSDANYLFHQNAYTCVGFFAEVFRANPARMEEWRTRIDREEGGDTKYWLRKAMDLQRSGSKLSIGMDNSLGLSDLQENYVSWGAFIASGNTAYLRKLIDHTEFIGEVDWLFGCGAEAMVLLAVNSPYHPLIRDTLAATRKEASPRLGKLIDDLLEKDMEAVYQEVRQMEHVFPYTRIILPWMRPTLPKTEPFIFESK